MLPNIFKENGTGIKPKENCLPRRERRGAKVELRRRRRSDKTYYLLQH
jgi:hypothetical protein